MMVMIRLSISLPGIAVGDDMTLRDAWAVTRGNTLQLCGGTLLLYLPSYVIDIADRLSGSLLTLLLVIGADALTAVAAISFLSLSYRFLAATAGSGDRASR
jgi:hypothetical protein